MKPVIYLLIILLPLYTHAQKTDKKLQASVEALIKDFHGDIGIYVHDLKHNRIIQVNADTIFPTASIVKIPIMIGVMDKIEKGELQYHQRLIYSDSLFYDEGDDIASRLKDSADIELSKVMMLMLTISDNCASLWLQGLCGGGKNINAILENNGYANTRVNSRTTGREASRSKYGWGQTTPKEMVSIMEKIVNGEMLSQKSSERMLRLLGRQYWDEEGLSAIPAGVFVADKNGAVDASRSEVMYVNGKKNPYIVGIFTKNNTDQSWEPDNKAWVLTRKLSALLWEYYEK